MVFIARLMVMAFIVAWAVPAEAQVYKFRRKDGSVVYTDKLSDLRAESPSPRTPSGKQKSRPPARRRLEASIGSRELARREADWPSAKPSCSERSSRQTVCSVDR